MRLRGALLDVRPVRISRISLLARSAVNGDRSGAPLFEFGHQLVCHTLVRIDAGARFDGERGVAEQRRTAAHHHLEHVLAADQRRASSL